jgi:hypothetical protein
MPPPPPPAPSGDSDAAAAEARQRVFRRLAKWAAEEGGGYVHPDLRLVAVGSAGRSDHEAEQDEEDGAYDREVAAARDIPEGTLLIRIPSSLALGYRPASREPGVAGGGFCGGASNGPGSPWLRCLAALYRAQDGAAAGEDLPSSWKPYLDSLPASCSDTLMDWTDEELGWLEGTGLHASLLPEETKDEGDERGEKGRGRLGHRRLADGLRDRYVERVRPRLLELGLVERLDPAEELASKELERFADACRAISTRCFHADAGAGDPTESAAGTTAAAAALRPGSGGPYFLPVIDLLNHHSGGGGGGGGNDAPAARAATRLTVARSRGGNGDGALWFEMRAERDIAAGEPVRHSYGDALTSSQCLHTFGFVPETASEARASAPRGAAGDGDGANVSPCVLTKDLVLECCRRAIQRELEDPAAARLVRENQPALAGGPTSAGADDDDASADETWELRDDPDRDYSSFPSHFLVTPAHPLPDDLATLLCLPFLPGCAYRELAGDVPSSPSPPLLDRTVLDDAFLGQLAARAVLDVVRRKSGEYPPLRLDGELVEVDDRALLNELLRPGGGGEGKSSPSSARAVHRSSAACAVRGRRRRRLVYSLTIRLEERSCLDALRREAIRVLVRATGGDSDDDGLDEPATVRSDARRPTSPASGGGSKRGAHCEDPRESHHPRTKRPKDWEAQEAPS